ncbi:MAG: prepilin-type N-terminal cleavage/methylation domain-containing protein [Pseudomonadales bacterium]|nr:prepilin-type N-terminal cleavage/methylation domain-containing protein [Pseudomonadales bacterium]
MVVDQDHGFTLIELLTVIGIISTLSLFLWKDYDEEVFNRKVYTTIRSAQDLVNAVSLVERGVTNPDASNYQYEFANDNDETAFTIASINGNAAPGETLLHSEGTFTSAHQFNRRNTLVSATVEVPGVNWSSTFPRAKITLYSTNDTENDAARVELYPRWTGAKVSVDLTATSRFLKSYYYWQLTR